MASSRVEHPAVVVASGFKKRLLAITDRQVAPHKSRPHASGRRSQLHNSRLKMYIFPSHSPSAGLERKTHASGARS
jgi:hypothetical protein